MMGMGLLKGLRCWRLDDIKFCKFLIKFLFSFYFLFLNNKHDKNF